MFFIIFSHYKKLVFLVFACFFFVLFGYSQKTDKKLQKKVEEIISSFQGEVGFYYKSLKSNKIVSINENSIFPTASIVKIPILIGIMDKINKNELEYHQSTTYKDSLLYEGVDILGSFKNGEKIEISKLIMLMMTMSDNTASLWLQSLAGGGLRINEILDSNKFINTRVNSRTKGREEDRTNYGWGQTTAKEMTLLINLIVDKKIISEVACERMMRSLKKNYWDAEALSQLPATVNVFSKNGAVNKSRSEVVYVNAPNGDYVFCILTKNNKDESWNRDNEAWEMIRKISLTTWKHQERKSKWKPEAEESKKWF